MLNAVILIDALEKLSPQEREKVFNHLNQPTQPVAPLRKKKNIEVDPHHENVELAKLFIIREKGIKVPCTQVLN